MLGLDQTENEKHFAPLVVRSLIFYSGQTRAQNNCQFGLCSGGFILYVYMLYVFMLYVHIYYIVHTCLTWIKTQRILMMIVLKLIRRRAAKFLQRIFPKDTQESKLAIIWYKCLTWIKNQFREFLIMIVLGLIRGRTVKILQSISLS